MQVSFDYKFWFSVISLLYLNAFNFVHICKIKRGKKVVWKQRGDTEVSSFLRLDFFWKNRLDTRGSARDQSEVSFFPAGRPRSLSFPQAFLFDLNEMIRFPGWIWAIFPFNHTRGYLTGKHREAVLYDSVSPKLFARMRFFSGHLFRPGFHFSKPTTMLTFS